jgi:hypothetical protein
MALSGEVFDVDKGCACVGSVRRALYRQADLAKTNHGY